MSKANKIVVVNGVKQDLNGLPVKFGAHYSSLYTGVSYGRGAGRCGWHSEEGQYMYTALAGLDTPEEKALCGYKGHTIHLSHHEDAREAAYVALKFKENKEENLKLLKKVGVGNWECEIPAFEYEALDTDENAAVRATRRASQPKAKTVRAVKTARITVETVRQAANTELRAVVAKIGGMSEAIKIREMVEGQTEYFASIDDAVSMVNELISIKIAA